MKLEYVIKQGEKFDNVKEVLKTKFDISDRLLFKLKTNKKIYINKVPCSIDLKVSPGDLVEAYLNFEEDNSNIIAKKMDLSILYEDEFLLILNKPAGFPVHPSMLHYEDSISNGVKYYFDSKHLHKKIRPVNRLDKDTSGIVIFAKNEYAQESLSRQMHSNLFKKEYIAICNGVFKNQSGTINAPIARMPNSIIQRCVRYDGDASVTHYNVIKTDGNISVVHVILETGRTHQIRVHFSYIGNPILGDTLYGSSSELISRQALHSYKVTFLHPVSHNTIILTAPLYEDMEKLL